MHPAGRDELLKSEHVKGVASHLSTVAKVEPLFRAWLDKGVRFVVFKGLYFANSIYPSSGFRRYNDVDGCVAQADLLKAREIARHPAVYHHV